MRKKFWSEYLKGGDHSEDLCVDETILEQISGKEGGEV